MPLAEVLPVPGANGVGGSEPHAAQRPGVVAAGVRLARGWFALAVAAFALATLCAGAMVVMRALGPALAGAGFHTALVLHVGLATLIWFLAFGAAASCAAGSERFRYVGWAGLGLMAAGAVAMLVTPLAGSARPILSNYVPALEHPLYLAGLAWVACGYALAALRAIVTIGARELPGDGPGWPALAAAVAGCMALVALAASLASAPTGGALHGYVELVAWPVGHGLQFVHVCLLVGCWAWMASVAGVQPSPRVVGCALAVTVAAATLVPVLAIQQAMQGTSDRELHTLLMRWGTWPGPALVAGAIGLARLRGGRCVAGAERTALLLSMTLFATGLVLGTAIRGDTAMVPAHYHATIGAVTLAFMGASVRLVALFGGRTPDAGRVRRQLCVYASGLALMIAGLALSGLLGGARKGATFAAFGGTVAESAATLLCALGACVAVLGGLMYAAWVAGAFVSPGRGTRRASRRAPTARSWPDRRTWALSLTVVLVLAVGAVIAWLPPSGPSSDAQAPAQAAQHARDARREEVDARFRQAVVMLHARRYDHALTALHRVLELAPNLPEAHVNMGFALLGLGKPAAARDFFESATVLRPQQTNAYYGLAMALEGLQDLPGAIGAMRTYLHLAPADDPHARKAGAALWEWEAARDAAGKSAAR